MKTLKLTICSIFMTFSLVAQDNNLVDPVYGSYGFCGTPFYYENPLERKISIGFTAVNTASITTTSILMSTEAKTPAFYCIGIGTGVGQMGYGFYQLVNRQRNPYLSYYSTDVYRVMPYFNVGFGLVTTVLNTIALVRNIQMKQDKLHVGVFGYEDQQGFSGGISLVRRF